MTRAGSGPFNKKIVVRFLRPCRITIGSGFDIDDNARIEHHTPARLRQPDTVINILAGNLAETAHASEKLTAREQESSRRIMHVSHVHVWGSLRIISRTVAVM